MQEVGSLGGHGHRSHTAQVKESAKHKHIPLVPPPLMVMQIVTVKEAEYMKRYWLA